VHGISDSQTQPPLEQREARDGTKKINIELGRLIENQIAVRADLEVSRDAFISICSISGRYGPG
jgi:hypothetical protein